MTSKTGSLGVMVAILVGFVITFIIASVVAISLSTKNEDSDLNENISDNLRISEYDRYIINLKMDNYSSEAIKDEAVWQKQLEEISVLQQKFEDATSNLDINIGSKYKTIPSVSVSGVNEEELRFIIDLDIVSGYEVDMVSFPS